MNRYSTFWPRVLAGFVDSLVFSPLIFANLFFMSHKHDSLFWIMWVVVSYSVYPIYSVTLHARYGQTLGKMAAKIRVMNLTEDRNPSLQQAILRDIGDIIIAIAILIFRIYLIVNHKDSMEVLAASTFSKAFNIADNIWFWLEFITMLTNKKRRAIHDFIAGTVVVRLGVPPELAVGLDDPHQLPPQVA